MAGLSGTSALGSTLATALGQIKRKKSPSREEIFAAQDAVDASKAAASGDTKAEFVKFAKMSPAERIRAAYLKEHGLSEETLASLPQEEREKVEQEIKKLIKTKLGLDKNGRTGQIVDVTV